MTGRTVGQRLVEGLAARGVDCVFGIPGVHTIELYRGLAGSGVRHVTVRHEQGAAFAADGYARVTGRPGVAFVITGPGVTNALTAMAQARADSVPMLVVSGVNRRDSLGRGLGMLHELPDQAGMVRSLCPTLQVTAPDALHQTLDQAFALMLGGRPQPVHLEVPTDVMPMPAPPVPAAPPVVLPWWLADPGAVEAGVARLQSARSPVILAGGGTRRSDAALRLLAERLDAPVVQTTNARGLLHGHPLCVPASPSLNAVRRLIAEADVVLAVGTELGSTDCDMYVRGGFPDLSGMIRIDCCREQLARHPAAVRIHGLADPVLAALWRGLSPLQGDGTARAAAARQAARAELDAYMHPQLAMVEAIRDAMPDAVIVGDSTQPVYAGNLYYDAPFPGAWFNAATGFGALGYAPGAAVGAAIGSGRRVVCLIGDGGMQFSPGELRTAVDERLPVTFAVWNNAGFREIAEAMAGAGAPVIGCHPSPLAMEPFAAACGLPFARVGPDPAALRAALGGAAGGPRLIEIAAG
ncbi:MAG: 5-guanidino-2-oxopentanoate decarboxylase [Paracoccaceae bacterium]|nr:MAG: 5-guanidino-2-oxopentanoate decarboxylase [Paracoccaceae bacterium]